MANDQAKMAFQSIEKEFDERVVEIARVAKVVKGGRRFQFRVTIVAGDNNGTIGLGIGKANAVPEAMNKATLRAHKNLHKICLSGTTIPHEVIGKEAGARVLLKPASPGTGVIAGSGVRAGGCWYSRYFNQVIGQRKYLKYCQSYFFCSGTVKIPGAVK
jgi:small subunit ribosomal protein S5